MKEKNYINKEQIATGAIIVNIYVGIYKYSSLCVSRLYV